MSPRQTERESTIPHPRETSRLFGHREAEAALLTAYRSGRIPHAWLIGGPQGIGKATLAYRMARFVLAHSQPLAPAVQRAENLAIDPDDAVARQVAAGSHGGLLTLERTANDRGVMRTVITVDETRETIAFFGSTAAAEGWRVCIVDTVDELNPNAANALLKILEEPPQQSLFLLVSHAPARVLATIQSRCRKLRLRPLATDDVIAAAASAAELDPNDPALREAAEASEGSVARALTLLGGDPFEPENQRVLLPFLRRMKQELPGKTVWAYSGYTLEELRKEGSHPRCECTDEMLGLIDILVDGRFIQAQKDISLRFRGSRNQRVIDLPETLRSGEIVLSPYGEKGGKPGPSRR